MAEAYYTARATTKQQVLDGINNGNEQFMPLRLLSHCWQVTFTFVFVDHIYKEWMFLHLTLLLQIQHITHNNFFKSTFVTWVSVLGKFLNVAKVAGLVSERAGILLLNNCFWSSSTEAADVIFSLSPYYQGQPKIAGVVCMINLSWQQWRSRLVAGCNGKTRFGISTPFLLPGRPKICQHPHIRVGVVGMVNVS